MTLSTDGATAGYTVLILIRRERRILILASPTSLKAALADSVGGTFSFRNVTLKISHLYALPGSDSAYGRILDETPRRALVMEVLSRVPHRAFAAARTGHKSARHRTPIASVNPSPTTQNKVAAAGQPMCSISEPAASKPTGNP